MKWKIKQTQTYHSMDPASFETDGLNQHCTMALQHYKHGLRNTIETQSAVSTGLGKPITTILSAAWRRAALPSGTCEDVTQQKRACC